MHTKLYLENLKGRHNFGDLYIDGKIIKYRFKKSGNYGEELIE
jgi:hypothetical protein